jgi:hypothetical protein
MVDFEIKLSVDPSCRNLAAPAAAEISDRDQIYCLFAHS